MKKKQYKLDYEEMVQKALRGVIHQSLSQILKFGLTGSHHLYISFVTNHPGVIIPDHLHEEYPDEMTIVLQHEFWDLVVSKSHFELTLCFDDSNEHITVPFEAITSFVDPSVKFGLQFTPEYGEVDIHDNEVDSNEKDKKKEMEPKKENKKKSKSSKNDKNNVITLDSFRKN